MIKITDIYWLAGLYEGEGCFQCDTSPRMQLKMTDEDTVVKARGLIKKDAKIAVRQHTNGNKTSYIFYNQGINAISWMMTLYPLMSRRRKEKIREIISKWKNLEKRSKGADYCINGHSLIDESNYTLVSNDNGGFSKKCRICYNNYRKEYNSDELVLIRGIKKLGITKEQLDEIARKFKETIQ